jgi:hypothetical protein
MRKFWEGLDFGRVTNQVAYAEDQVSLPEPMAGAVWREDEKFDERSAVDDDPELARVFERARMHGCAIVKRLV